MISIRDLDDGLEMIVDVFSDGVCDPGTVLRAGEGVSDGEAPSVKRGSDRDKLRMIRTIEPVDDIRDEIQSILEVSFVIVVKQILKNVVGRKKDLIEFYTGEDHVGKVNGSAGTFRDIHFVRYLLFTA